MCMWVMLCGYMYVGICKGIFSTSSNASTITQVLIAKSDTNNNNNNTNMYVWVCRLCGNLKFDTMVIIDILKIHTKCIF